MRFFADPDSSVNSGSARILHRYEIKREEFLSVCCSVYADNYGACLEKICQTTGCVRGHPLPNRFA